MDCIYQPELNLDEWADLLLDPLDGARYPLSGSIELTERCNLTCAHCYINQSAADPVVRSRELDAAQWKTIIDQLADAGCLFLLLTGGEPLLRADFSEIFVHARRRGMLVTLFTNATMLTPRIARLLAEWSVHSVEVSLYGATQETYEAVTRQPDSFERCLRGIELALEHRLKIDLKTVLLTLNRHELEQMQALTHRFGLDFRYDSSLWPRVNGDMSPLQYAIPMEETLDLDLNDEHRRGGWLETAEQFKGIMLRAGKVFTCGAGYLSFHIDSRGRLSPCMMARTPSYPVLPLGFQQAWHELGAIREMTRQMQTECETCPVAALCTQCPGWSLAVYGDYETPVPEVCALGKTRAAQIAGMKV